MSSLGRSDESEEHVTLLLQGDTIFGEGCRSSKESTAVMSKIL